LLAAQLIVLLLLVASRHWPEFAVCGQRLEIKP
jgi:hypothetical protein